MSQPHDLSTRLQEAIALAKQVQQHPEANRVFDDMIEAVRCDHPLAADLLTQLWQEYMVSQRSSLFWEQLSEVEKNLSDRMGESHIQLKQNYLRLIQEQ